LLVGLCPDSLDALAESWGKGGERGEGRAGGERKWRGKRGRGEGEDGKEVGGREGERRGIPPNDNPGYSSDPFT